MELNQKRVKPMRKIAILTGTRAEYGLLRWIIQAVENDPDLMLQLVVTGTHLSPEYGYTVKEIERNGIQIAEKIDMLLSSDSTQGTAKSMGVLIISLAQAFERLKPDLLVILGDRFEVLAAASTAVAMNIPIAHLCGGESTEGAIDEQIRHAITKMAHLHFAQTEYYKQRIIKMGEEEWRVFNTGVLAYETIKRLDLLRRDELEIELGIKLVDKLFVVTFHPVTLERDSLEEQIDNLLLALSEFKNTIIFTYPNSDSGGRLIASKINEFISHRSNAYVFYSLGQKKYLSLLKHADAMIGNSSSGILEAPFLNLPVVNIGNRQKGRLRSKNIIDVTYDREAVRIGIAEALSENFTASLQGSPVLFGDGQCSYHIIQAIKKSLDKENIMVKMLSLGE
jgi:GDP/UDP-N,N'-diacetylbacillosamine 2-epimerase (hydrolysing)